MYKNYKISTPFFEFGPKAYIWGEELLALAKQLDRLANKYDIDIILEPQTTDLRLIAGNTSERIHVFAQHMDPIRPGRGMGTILAEAVRDTGAVGVMLNHAERKLTLPEIASAIARADEVGLATMVCADTEEEIRAVAALEPNIIVAEPSDLIGTGIAVVGSMGRPALVTTQQEYTCPSVSGYSSGQTVTTYPRRCWHRVRAAESAKLPTALRWPRR